MGATSKADSSSGGREAEREVEGTPTGDIKGADMSEGEC